MLCTPMSSPQMTTMLGLLVWACAEAKRLNASQRAGAKCLILIIDGFLCLLVYGRGSAVTADSPCINGRRTSPVTSLSVGELRRRIVAHRQALFIQLRQDGQARLVPYPWPPPSGKRADRSTPCASCSRRASALRPASEGNPYRLRNQLLKGKGRQQQRHDGHGRGNSKRRGLAPMIDADIGLWQV